MEGRVGRGVSLEEWFAKDMARSRETVAYLKEYAEMADEELKITSALFQEALSHLEVALGEFPYGRDDNGDFVCGSCQQEIHVGSFLVEQGHAEDCKYAAAERFLDEHRSKWTKAVVYDVQTS